VVTHNAETVDIERARCVVDPPFDHLPGPAQLDSVPTCLGGVHVDRWLTVSFCDPRRTSRSVGCPSTPPRMQAQPLAVSPSYQSLPAPAFPSASTFSPHRKSTFGSSTSYAFPPTSPIDGSMALSGSSRRSVHPESSRSSIASMSSTEGATARLSISKRPRRPSPLLHEIQPPIRRLSSHQMLLLTPFGGVIPAGALPSDSPFAEYNRVAGGGMSRGSSSMGRSGSSSGMPMAGSMSRGSSSMGKEPREHRLYSAPPLSYQNRALASRNRHHSLMNSIVGPSPLASAPMTTIPSHSDHGSSSGTGSAAPSREPSDQDRERLPSLVGGTPGTVPMTRSNSLPVMTIREMQALREKDSELGIARGGGWAWVASRQEEVDDDR